ncbi:HalOD1 output domain-containing protein [Haladaptatus sp. DYF46]|uniref:HalOD1 output domain-containing protein n=1 Tax=Haladaptatus sp. DYF46 TaxID=2886041 RepID=UPI001E627196|nr:HalOD1 output domain-containing protein [Haladaptatus sp. DYF46]
MTRKYLEPIEITENETSNEGEMVTSYLYDISSYLSQGDACVGIIAALASRTHQGELTLPPLGAVIDAGALDSLLGTRRPSDGVSVTFPYGIYMVTVSGDGTVLIRNGVH